MLASPAHRQPGRRRAAGRDHRRRRGRDRARRRARRRRSAPIIRNQVGAIIAVLGLLYVAEPLLGFIPAVGPAVQEFGSAAWPAAPAAPPASPPPPTCSPRHPRSRCWPATRSSPCSPARSCCGDATSPRDRNSSPRPGRAGSHRRARIVPAGPADLTRPAREPAPVCTGRAASRNGAGQLPSSASSARSRRAAVICSACSGVSLRVRSIRNGSGCAAAISAATALNATSVRPPASSNCSRGEGAPVVLLGSAAHVARPRRPDQARVREHLQVMRDVALVAVQRRGELAYGRFALAEGEQQPVAHRVAQGLELLRRGDGDGVFLHRSKVLIFLDALSSVCFH